MTCDNKQMNPFQAMAVRDAKAARALAKAFSAVSTWDSSPDEDASAQLYAILRYVSAALNLPLSGYLAGCHFEPLLGSRGLDALDYNDKFLEVQKLACEYLEKK